MVMSILGFLSDGIICNGIDNDCDGAVDEDYTPSSTTCGIGECAADGETFCEDGGCRRTPAHPGL